VTNHSETEYWKLRGVPGYCLEPMSWDSATALINEGTFESLGKLGRSPEDVAVYWDFRSKVSGGLGNGCREVRNTLRATACVSPAINPEVRSLCSYCS
jgi:hypothetical protein